jgi:CheY-like chemotaxis protein
MDDSFENDLRKALNNLYDLNQLRHSPLCKQFGVDTFYDAPGRLQHILEDAIGALKPKSKEAHLAHAWDTYEMLSLRYLQQFSQKEVSDQLGVSLSQMNRIQHRALEAVAMHLAGKYPALGGKAPDTKAKPAPVQEKTAAPAQPEPPSPPADPSADLAWMSVSSPEKSTDLIQRLAEVQEILQPFLEKYSVELEASGIWGPVEVLVYPVALRQILLNLLTSAIHILANGQIRLSIARLESDTDLVIEGRTPDFDQVVVSEDLKTNLEIAVRFARLSGGELTFASHQDTWRAVLHLPCRSAIPVLIIDDSLDALRLLERFVAGTQYRVVGSPDPQQALALAESSHAQVIIVDVMMPQIDGWELLQKLRHHPATAHLPLVTCSILRQEELAFSLGATAYLRKPVSQEALLQVLNQVAGHAASTPGQPG